MSVPKLDFAEDILETLEGRQYQNKAETRAEVGERVRRSTFNQMDALVKMAQAEGRDLRADEQRAYDKLRASHERAGRLVNGAETELKMARASGSNGDPQSPPPGSEAIWSGTGSPYLAGTARRDDKRDWANTVASEVVGAIRDHGIRGALTAGGIDVPSVVEPVVEHPADAPRRVLELLVNRKPLDGNAFSFLRETVRTPQAAVVADGALKPTSTYTFTEVEDRARVVAHLSEAIPLRLIEDHGDLARVLQNQMAEDVWRALESECLTGDGTGEHFKGVLETSGIRAQAFATDPFVTLRTALTSSYTYGELPTAWVLHPTDLQTLDMARESGATGAFLAGIDVKVFGGLPVVTSTLVPVGTALLGDWEQARLYVRGQGRIDADTSGELFDKNQLKLRVEGRFGFAVLRPSAFMAIDLIA